MSKLHCFKSPKKIDGLITFRKYMQLQWMNKFSFDENGILRLEDE